MQMISCAFPRRLVGASPGEMGRLSAGTPCFSEGLPVGGTQHGGLKGDVGCCPALSGRVARRGGSDSPWCRMCQRFVPSTLPPSFPARPPETWKSSLRCPFESRNVFGLQFAAPKTPSPDAWAGAKGQTGPQTGRGAGATPGRLPLPWHPHSPVAGGHASQSARSQRPSNGLSSCVGFAAGQSHPSRGAGTCPDASLPLRGLRVPAPCYRGVNVSWGPGGHRRLLQ